MTIAQTTGYVPGMSPAWQALENVVAEIAPTDIPVLLIGEIGTGKEMVAQRLHQLSRRASAPWICVKCPTATAGSLLGHLVSDSSGKSNVTAIGTIFFDEIGELDGACQRNLLYALPDGETINHRGVLRERVISSTTRNLEEDLRAGRFRAELFYRINGLCLRLPPLREHKEDIPLLLEYFLTKLSADLVRARPHLSAAMMRRLMDHDWPGNIRELENVARKVVALGENSQTLSRFDEFHTAEPCAAAKTESRSYSLKAAARAASRKAEKELILGALERTRWNRKRAAQELQISYKSLLYKLKQIGIANSRANS
jgi:two-component system, NtrC family, response regulator AtoC